VIHMGGDQRAVRVVVAWSRSLVEFVARVEDVTRSVGAARAKRVARIIHRLLSVVLAVAIAGLTLLLIRYASGADDYYAGGDTSRWEHARGWGASSVFAAAVVVSAASALALFVSGLWRRRWNAVAGVIASATAVVALLIAWVAINAGH
jgi:hypothetical protein